MLYKFILLLARVPLETILLNKFSTCQLACPGSFFMFFCLTLFCHTLQGASERNKNVNLMMWVMLSYWVCDLNLIIKIILLWFYKWTHVTAAIIIDIEVDQEELNLIYF